MTVDQRKLNPKLLILSREVYWSWVVHDFPALKLLVDERLSLIPHGLNLIEIRRERWPWNLFDTISSESVFSQTRKVAGSWVCMKKRELIG